MDYGRIENGHIAEGPDFGDLVALPMPDDPTL
jgi:hypothetical protein